MIKLARKDLVLDKTVRRLCREPYEGHPKGCPNWGQKEGCPPQALLLSKILDLHQPVYLVYNQFDFGAHVRRMKKEHPDWSPRQLSCCLYWQGTARKQLRNLITLALLRLGAKNDLRALECPEACGVNITATMANIGVELEWPPVNVTYQVALIGHEREA